MELITRRDVITQAIDECIDRLYAEAQPSIPLGSLQDAIKAFKEEPKETQTKYPFYSRYYIPNDLYNEICEMYMSAYTIINPFKDHMDTVRDYLKDGGHKDKYITPEDGSPGYRGYEEVPSFEKQFRVIMEEAFGNNWEDNQNAKYVFDKAKDKVFELIDECKNFYNPNRDEVAFRFNVGDVSPTTNIEHAREYWASKDPTVVIKEKKYDPDEDEWVFDEEKEP